MTHRVPSLVGNFQNYYTYRPFPFFGSKSSPFTVQLAIPPSQLPRFGGSKSWNVTANLQFSGSMRTCLGTFFESQVARAVVDRRYSLVSHRHDYELLNFPSICSSSEKCLLLFPSPPSLDRICRVLGCNASREWLEWPRTKCNDQVSLSNSPHYVVSKAKRQDRRRCGFCW